MAAPRPLLPAIGLLLATATASAQFVTDRAFYNGFENRSTQVFSGIVQESPYFGAPASYATPNGQGDAMTSSVRANLIVDRVCDVKLLFGQLYSVDATYTSATLLLNVNGIDTSVGCAMTTAFPTCVDSFHKVGIGPNDRVTLKVAPILPARPISNVDSDVKVAVRFGWTCEEL